MTVASNNSWDGLITGPEYDQPLSEPHTTYLICGLPRSGSSYLCDRLYHAGYGVPSEYWFPHLPTQLLIQRWGASSAAEYLKTLPTRRSQNGIFGIKTHWAQYRKTQWVWGRPDIHFKDIRYIRIRRRDLERQAVSWWLAAATDYWNDVGFEPQPRSVPPFRMEDIEKLYRGLLVQSECWDNFLSHHDHLEIVFEDLLDDCYGAVTDVEDFLGVRSTGDIPQPSDPLIKKMSIPGSADLLEAYREWRIANAE